MSKLYFHKAGSLILLGMFFIAAGIIYGSPSGITGATLKGGGGCTCHTASSNAGVSLTISGPSSLITGQTADYKVVMNYNASITGAGINIAASDGNLITNDPKMKVLSGELTHPSAQKPATTSMTWSFKYTAPAAAGEQTLYASGCAVKNSWNNAPNFSITVTAGSVLSLLTPPAGISYVIGTTKNITWTGLGVTNAKIESSTDNGSTWSTISASTSAALGTYAWTIPNTPSTQCLIKISDVDNPAISNTSSPFSIKAVASMVALWELTSSGNATTYGNVWASSIDTLTPKNIAGLLGHSFVTGTISGLMLGVSGPTNWPADGTTTTADAAFVGLSNGTTPRYIQFSITPNFGYDVLVDSMSIQACQNITAALQYVATGYSVNGADYTLFNSNGSAGNGLLPTSGLFSTFSTAPSILLNYGDTLTMRMVLWRKGSSSASKTAVYVANSTFYGSTSPVTSVGKNDVTTADGYQLHQNYPNPFNPSTVIGFSIPEQQHVSILVYNSLGQIVSALVNKNYEAGNHSVSFNASSLPSGLYIYKMQAGAKSLTGKMVLQK